MSVTEATGLLDHVGPRLEGWRRAGSIPAPDWRELAALGVVGRESFAEVAATIAELSRTGDVGLVGAYAINEICHRLLVLTGSDELRPAVAAGEARLALGLTERASGSDMASMATRAERAEDGGERLTGEKVYISNATVADWFLVAARTGSGSSLPTFTLYRVPAERVRIEDMHGVGARLMRLATVTLDGVPVNDEEVLGRRGRGFRYVNSVLAFERAIVACICVHVAGHLLEDLRGWLTTRSVFGQTLSEHEYHRLRYARWGARHRVIAAAHAQLLGAFDGAGVSEAEIFSLKIEAAELVRDLAVEAQHLRGASAWVADGALSGIYDDVRWLSLAGGATEALLMTLAEQALNGG